MIDSFRGENFYLSNMYPLQYPILTRLHASAATSEHAYQAAKFSRPDLHYQVAGARAAHRAKGEQLDGIASKNLAHEFIDAGALVVPDWNLIKVGIMQEVVRRKFIANPDIRMTLAETGDEELVEGNDWGDLFWGVDHETGEGLNHLGKVLMEVRTDVQAGKYL